MNIVGREPVIVEVRGRREEEARDWGETLGQDGEEWMATSRKLLVLELYSIREERYAVIVATLLLMVSLLLSLGSSPHHSHCLPCAISRLPNGPLGPYNPYVPFEVSFNSSFNPSFIVEVVRSIGLIPIPTIFVMKPIRLR